MAVCLGSMSPFVEVSDQPRVLFSRSRYLREMFVALHAHHVANSQPPSKFSQASFAPHCGKDTAATPRRSLARANSDAVMGAA